MLGIDWNGDGMINGFDHVIDMMIINEMEEEEDEEKEDE